MWRYRRKSSRNDSNINNNDYGYGPKARRTPPNPDFNHQSFKDIETLFPRASDYKTIPEQPSSSSQNCSTDVRRLSIFHRLHLANRVTRAFSARPKPDPEEILSQVTKDDAVDTSENLEKSVKPDKLETLDKPLKSEPAIDIPGADKRVVVYMTSLRVVRSTFEACRTVRSILQGFRVPIDERDLSMDSSFFDEIRKIMAQIDENGGYEHENTRVPLPRVFIGGRYIGGADEVVELHEVGELKKFVKGLPAVTPGVCKNCGGFRFILCHDCNGSHKCPLEDGGFTTCTVCNENGLIRNSSFV